MHNPSRDKRYRIFQDGGGGHLYFFRRGCIVSYASIFKRNESKYINLRPIDNVSILKMRIFHFFNTEIGQLKLGYIFKSYIQVSIVKRFMHQMHSK